MNTDPPQSPVRAVRTLVLTDIVDSTALVEEIGDLAAADLFARIDRLTRDLLKTHSGQEIDRTDGFLLSFERPIDGVAMTLQLHEALAALSKEVGRSIEVRAAVHVGDVVIRANAPEDIRNGAKPIEIEGLAKPFAARLMSLALGGQTLLSQSARDLAAGAAVGDPAFAEVTWVSHGLWTLKGVSEPVPVHEVTSGAPRRPTATGKARAHRPLRKRLMRAGAVAAAVLVVGMGIAGIAAWSWLHPTLDDNAPVFTVDGAATIYEDPAKQELVDRAWRAFLDDDILRSADYIRPLLNEPTIPAEVLVLTMGLGLSNEATGSAFSRVDPESLTAMTPSALCVRNLHTIDSLANDPNSAGPASIARVFAHLAQARIGLGSWMNTHPGDLLALECLTSFTNPDIADREATLERLRRATPGEGAPRFVAEQVRGHIQDRQWAKADAVITQARTERPLDVALLHAEAHLRTEQGDTATAQRLIEQAIEVDPGRMQLRQLAARIALERGDEALLRRHLKLLLSPEWPNVQQSTAGALTIHALGCGRPDVATELFALSTPRNGSAIWHFLFYTGLPGFYPPDAEQRVIRTLDAQLSRDELPHAKRTATWALATVRLHHLLKLGAAEIPDETVAESEQVNALFRGKAASTAWAGDPTEMLTRIEAFYEEDSHWVRPAERPFMIGVAYDVGADRTKALEHYRAFLADDRAGDSPRTMRAMAAGNLALDAMQRGDPSSADPWLAIYRGAWPAPDPAIPLVMALAEAGVPPHAPMQAQPTDENPE